MDAYKASIAYEAFNLVHGERAKDYGHPRKDFRVIAKVWTGLLQDLLQDGAELDEHRVAILMSGLKLARLVKSPQHHDSRVDTIGYMLTMERLDEPEWEEDLLAGKLPTVGEVRRERPPCFSPAPDELEDENTGPVIHPSDKPATGDINTYVFPVGNEAPYAQHSIFAHSYKEARQKFQEWLKEMGASPVLSPSERWEKAGKPSLHPEDEGPEMDYVHELPGEPVLNPLTDKPLGPGEVVASLSDNGTSAAATGMWAVNADGQWFPPGTPDFSQATGTRERKLLDDMGGVNPTDDEVALAKSILERRAAFHDREAQELFPGPQVD